MTDIRVAAPPAPRPQFAISVTGHRQSHGCYAEGADRIEAALSAIMDSIDSSIGELPSCSGDTGQPAVRLATLLADGTDQLTARIALARGYRLQCPLPFGQALNAAINSHPTNLDDARSICAGGPARHPQTALNLAAIQSLAAAADLFELAEQDVRIRQLFLDALAAPGDAAKTQIFRAESAARVAVAGRILIEQSDLMIAVWDGVATALPGGTGDTVVRALECGMPVLWIDPARPDAWIILTTPEAIASPAEQDAGSRQAQLRAIVRTALEADSDAATARHSSAAGVRALESERWHKQSRPMWHSYRRVETLFGSRTWAARFASLTQTYETPETIAAGSAAPLLNTIATLDSLSADFAARIDARIVQRFAWADGISAYLSDCYRSGMTVNFLLSALAISGGIAYLPLVAPEHKWAFALFELALLLLILGITAIGQKRQWHDRWFETRRVAEYLRHAPIMLAIGVARPPGRWSAGSATSWPEHYARRALRSVGLPSVAVTPAYLRSALTGLLGQHVERQRDYHAAKAERLAAVHHNLDRFSLRLFQLAVLSVSVYLLLVASAQLRMIDPELVNHSSKLFTVLGVVLPTFGAAIAGIRFFGDFERFAAISKVASDKLDAIHHRIAVLATSADDGLTYARVADLAHAADDVVVAEIESWQAVFAGKHITVPV